MSDDLKSNIERGTGDKFINWYNAQNGTEFSYAGKPNKAPDLTYSDGRQTVHIEITMASGSQEAVKELMEFIREKPDGPRSSPSNSGFVAASDINVRLAEKCRNDYGRNCILIVRHVADQLMTLPEYDAVVAEVVVPERNPFRGIYLTDWHGQHFWKII